MPLIGARLGVRIPLDAPNFQKKAVERASERENLQNFWVYPTLSAILNAASKYFQMGY